VIVRILGEGQFRVDDDVAAKLTALDKDLDAAVRDDEADVFTASLRAAVSLVRTSGAPLAADEIVTADYILPFSDATLDEVRKLLADGTIPGDSIGLPLRSGAAVPAGTARAAAHGESRARRDSPWAELSPGALRLLSGRIQPVLSVLWIG
jgi:hypothetical protein